MIELICLALNVYHEARGESEIAQIAVAHVTINRSETLKRKDKICYTVYKPKQFSWTRYKRKMPSKHNHEWQQALKSAALSLEIPDFTNGSTHYHAIYVSPKWAASMTPTGKWGNHLFYKERS